MVVDIIKLIIPELILVLGIWLVSLYWWSTKSWWARYAKLFKLKGKNKSINSVKLYHSGGGGYVGTFRVGAAKEGLLFKTYFVFRPFHPSILIPWEFIEDIKVKSIIGPLGRNKIGSTLGLSVATIKIKGEISNPITVSWHSCLGENLNEASNKRG